MTKNEEILKELQDIKAAMNLMNKNFEFIKQDYEQIKKNTEILKHNQYLKHKVMDLENQNNYIDNIMEEEKIWKFKEYPITQKKTPKKLLLML